MEVPEFVGPGPIALLSHILYIGENRLSEASQRPEVQWPESGFLKAPVPPTPGTIRPVVSGAYGCGSNRICKVKGVWLVPLDSKKTWQWGLSGYSEDTFSVGPGDTQG